MFSLPMPVESCGALRSIVRAVLLLQTGKDALQPAGLPAEAESAAGAGAGKGSGCTEAGMACDGADGFIYAPIDRVTPRAVAI